MEENQYRLLVPSSKEQALELMKKEVSSDEASKIPPKPENATWTDDQWKAIMAYGQDILVAAAAGSGKTAVLVEESLKKCYQRKIQSMWMNY